MDTMVVHNHLTRVPHLMREHHPTLVLLLVIRELLHRLIRNQAIRAHLHQDLVDHYHKGPMVVIPTIIQLNKVKIFRFLIVPVRCFNFFFLACSTNDTLARHIIQRVFNIMHFLQNSIMNSCEYEKTNLKIFEIVHFLGSLF